MGKFFIMTVLISVWCGGICDGVWAAAVKNSLPTPTKNDSIDKNKKTADNLIRSAPAKEAAGGAPAPSVKKQRAADPAKKRPVPLPPVVESTAAPLLPDSLPVEKILQQSQQELDEERAQAAQQIEQDRLAAEQDAEMLRREAEEAAMVVQEEIVKELEEARRAVEQEQQQAFDDSELYHQQQERVIQEEFERFNQDWALEQHQAQERLSQEIQESAAAAEDGK
ncbi:MAG: hypothetical protein NC924_01785 [Candidatus Omnitrophica bacterium]|nr:hypothetical protein [Candidatus Omnitrophota bacterium]